ncbi:unnamed protein product [Phyllotreta striolata]|uniref:Succinate-semialdehyde dehydrogenase, mitochondrial n=1 Tax=Phyllotreta striolata TaxID=444603 RepID=A0A9N9XK26_PHYSR|nr:unnamed protein product [Phyllotreta striolata]
MFSSAFLQRLLSTIYIITRKLNLIRDKNYINGEWVSAGSSQQFDVYNPADGSVIGKVPDVDAKDAKKAVAAAARAFETWKEIVPKKRTKLLKKWFSLLNKYKKEMANILTRESGKPLPESIGEVIYGNSYLEWFSEQILHIRGEIIPSDSTRKLLIEHHPIGVVVIITPWNFPYSMIARKMSAALAVGCTCVIKPSEETPLVALAMAKIAQKSGIPKGVINIITCSKRNAPSVGNLLCTSPLVSGVSFTGSTQVGKIIYKQCSKGVKRLALELGGNAPFIVFNSADVNSAIDGAMEAKFRNCGQTCVAANRFLIQDGVFEEFVCKMVKEVERLKIGNGLNEGVNIGPLINEAHLKKVTELMEDARCKGAKLLTGGKQLEKLGKLFFQPAVVTGVKNNMRLYTEEIFGPIVGVIKFETEEDCVRISNGTNYGLASYLFSKDVQQIFRVARKLEAGMVGVNECRAFPVETPFGGIKESGFGREGSHHGVLEYTYIKYTCLGDL